MIEADRVGVRVAGQIWLDEVSLDVLPGEILCVVGPNGAGKSTLLAIVHDPNLALLYADRVAMLAGGHLVAEGAPEDVITASLLHEVFGVEVASLRHPARDRAYAVPL